MNNMHEEAVALLRNLISIESLSRKEDKTADAIENFLKAKGVVAKRLMNNVWARNLYFDAGKPTILLNSHHDTVAPNAGYTRPPLEPIIEEGRIYGLGSNDAGGALVALLSVFIHFYDQPDIAYNLIFAASAEEEISGKNGVEALLPELGEIAFGIVGEPTGMHMAIAEKGLMVLDCEVKGISGHIARDEGENAIYKAIKDIEWFRTYQFPEKSLMLGPVKMAVALIQGGVQHNVVPGSCKYTVDIRTTDAYTNEEILKVVRQHVSGTLTPRSMRLKPSAIPLSHPLVQAGLQLGRNTYGSPTLSDQALMHFPTLKMGPGDSARSHTADEFIFIHEIEEAIELYRQLLEKIIEQP